MTSKNSKTNYFALKNIQWPPFDITILFEPATKSRGGGGTSRFFPSRVKHEPKKFQVKPSRASSFSSSSQLEPKKFTLTRIKLKYNKKTPNFVCAAWPSG